MVKQKRAAFSMSITTIVIIVIAIIMLVLGIVLVQKIMCGAMNIADTTLSGAEKQIGELFSSSGGDNVRCVGVDEQVTIVPDKTNIVGCAMKYDYGAENFKYKFEIKEVPNSNLKESQIKTWIKSNLEKTLGKIQPNQEKSFTLTIVPPKGTSRGNFEIDVFVDTGDGNGMTWQQTILVEVRDPGWVASSIC